MTQTFYRRPLPNKLVPFAGPEGRKLFREALADGSLEGYFALSEQFHTQADPAFCGLGSLVVALNALAIDPGRLWKGPWRWFDESLLDCCVPLEQVRTRGVTLGELSCLATCNGARAKVTYAAQADVLALRRAIEQCSRAADGQVLIAAYDRAALGQTGSGHYSPIGGYHRDADMALVLDVARFKYPPHWTPIDQLFQAMLPVDPQSGRSRGWVTLSADPGARPLFLSLGVPTVGWRETFEKLRASVRAESQGEESLAAWVEVLGRQDASALVQPLALAVDSLAAEHAANVQQLLGEVQATEAFRLAVAGAAAPGLEPLASPTRAATIVAVLALVLMREPPSPRELGPLLSAEVAALRRQLDALFGSCR